jgi:hypothetical protein
MEFRSKLLFSFSCRSDYQTIGDKEMSRFFCDLNQRNLECDLNSTESRIATELTKFDIFSTNWTWTFTEFQESCESGDCIAAMDDLDQRVLFVMRHLIGNGMMMTWQENRETISPSPGPLPA